MGWQQAIYWSFLQGYQSLWWMFPNVKIWFILKRSEFCKQEWVKLRTFRFKVWMLCSWEKRKLVKAGNRGIFCWFSWGSSLKKKKKHLHKRDFSFSNWFPCKDENNFYLLKWQQAEGLTTFTFPLAPFSNRRHLTAFPPPFWQFLNFLRIVIAARAWFNIWKLYSLPSNDLLKLNE